MNKITNAVIREVSVRTSSGAHDPWAILGGTPIQGSRVCIKATEGAKYIAIFLTVDEFNSLGLWPKSTIDIYAVEGDLPAPILRGGFSEIRISAKDVVIDVHNPETQEVVVDDLSRSIPEHIRAKILAKRAAKCRPYAAVEYKRTTSVDDIDADDDQG